MTVTIILAIVLLALVIAIISIVSQLNKSRSEVNILTEKKARLEEQLAAAERQAAAEREQMMRQNEQMLRQNEQMLRQSEERFKNLANDILESNSKKFKEQNEQRLSEILTPLRENIADFRKTVTDAYSAEARQRFALEERIKEIVEVNNTIGREAKELTRALRGNSKVQGDWGEMVLETILEKSGLKKDVHYSTQLTTDSDGATLRNDAGRQLRPDVVVYYPDGRCIVIDSKVSLTAYADMVKAEETSEAAEAGRRHVASVKAHIKELANKRYQDFIGDKQTDFVMMFIPNEGAYMSAMNIDQSLWQEAYDSRVIIISPTHLISALKLVEQIWRQDDMKRNVIEIANEGGRMYDKFVGFIEDMQRIEKSLDATRNSYDSAMKRLSTGAGNLVGKAEKLRKMGAKTSKQLPSSIIPEEE